MFITAFIMGLAGSLHCAGMCSPLMMTVTSIKGAVLSNRIFYNLGRITMYGIMGAFVASIGYMLPIGKFQNLVSVILGVTLIVFSMIGITGVKIPLVTRLLTLFTGILKKTFSKFLSHKSSWSLLLLGFLNGILPCGLTFLALSFCITIGTPVEGFAYMFFFGVGTLPVMLGLVSVVGWIRNRMHWNIKHVTTALMIVSGILLIGRVFLIHTPAGHDHGLVEIVICR